MSSTHLSGGLTAGLLALTMVLPTAHPVTCPMYGHDAGEHHAAEQHTVMHGHDARVDALTAVTAEIDGCGDLLDCGLAPVAPLIQAATAVPVAAVRHGDAFPGADLAEDNTAPPHTPPPRA